VRQHPIGFVENHHVFRLMGKPFDDR